MNDEAGDDVNQTVAMGEHGEWIGDLERLFLGDLSAERSAVVYAHVKACGTCERAWSRLAEAEKALFPRSEGRAFTPLAADRVRDRLFSAMPTEAPRPAAVLGRWLPWATLMGATAMAALLAVAVRGSSGPSSGLERPDELTPRSGAAVKLSGAVGVRALAVRERDAGAFDVEDLASAGALVPGDHVKLLGTSLEGERWVSAAVFDASGREVARVEPQLLAAGAADASLGRAMMVTAAWPVGQVKIVASFTAERPASGDELQRLSASDAPGRSVRVLTATVAERAAPRAADREGLK